MQAASCSKFTTTVLVAVGMLTNAVAQPPHAFEAPGRILEIVVVEILDRLADADRLLDRPDAVGIEPQAVAGKGGGERAEHLDVVIGREDPALQLVRLEAVWRLRSPGVRDDLVGGGLAAAAGLRVGVAIED